MCYEWANLTYQSNLQLLVRSNLYLRTLILYSIFKYTYLIYYIKNINVNSFLFRLDDINNFILKDKGNYKL